MSKEQALARLEELKRERCEEFSFWSNVEDALRAYPECEAQAQYARREAISCYHRYEEGSFI